MQLEADLLLPCHPQHPCHPGDQHDSEDGDQNGVPDIDHLIKMMIQLSKMMFKMLTLDKDNDQADQDNDRHLQHYHHAGPKNDIQYDCELS